MATGGVAFLMHEFGFGTTTIVIVVAVVFVIGLLAAINNAKDAGED